MSNLRQQLILRHEMLSILSPVDWPRAIMIGVKWRRCAGGASELTYHAAECRVHSALQLNSVFAPAALVGALPALGDQVLDSYPAGRPKQIWRDVTKMPSDRPRGEAPRELLVVFHAICGAV
ncbi:hypothetical protein IVB27_24660 [Bradyrhizobium sp. 197]|uniref:hypothetical protein n=1 Tax=Bradyrhizobium sp. 197 TaxID=2782663 RepID=UPI001FF96C41|nr:hypothetical protein [Bradyrhizobium sp. 197]MCK1477906.1 hypothetical protein [Bradyrhizobium sp. 197]